MHAFTTISDPQSNNIYFRIRFGLVNLTNTYLEGGNRGYLLCIFFLNMKKR